MKLATNESAGVGDELGGGAVWRMLPVDDDPDAVGERGRVLEVVRDEDRRQREVAEQLVQLGAHRRLGVGVQRRERLVEEEDAGIVRERAGERDALPLAARELLHARVA